MRELRLYDGLLRCPVCKSYKPLLEFAFENIHTGRRQSYCRACHAAYRHAHYLANRIDYVRRTMAQLAARRAINRRGVFDYLQSHPCIDCGADDVLVLEFDHRDPATKWKPIATLVMTKTWARVRAEIDKCNVRCVNCHRRRTAAQFRWNKAMQ
jgi:hypothetical protein